MFGGACACWECQGAALEAGLNVSEPGSLGHRPTPQPRASSISSDHCWGHLAHTLLPASYSKSSVLPLELGLHPLIRKLCFGSSHSSPSGCWLQWPFTWSYLHWHPFPVPEPLVEVESSLLTYWRLESSSLPQCLGLHPWDKIHHISVAAVPLLTVHFNLPHPSVHRNIFPCEINMSTDQYCKVNALDCFFHVILWKFMNDMWDEAQIISILGLPYLHSMSGEYFFILGIFLYLEV